MSRWLLLTCVFCAAAEPHAAGPARVVPIEGVTEYTFANGARALLFPEASRPTITINMTVLVGSRHEGYGESGMAHLLEHLVFKGTPTHPAIPKALRDHGATFNGSTNSDRTNYYETMPATAENLEFAIAVECDRLVNSFVSGDDLKSEMTVVRNEFERGENSPAAILNQRIYAAAYEWHNYGKSTIGSRSDIERVPIENLQAFYKKYYQPDNVVLIVAGKFDEAQALGLLEKYLGSIPRPARKLDATYTEEPPQDGERSVTLRRVGAVASVGVAYHIPSSAHPDTAALDLSGGIISQAPNGRLYRALVESKLATNANAGADQGHDPGLFFASASCLPESLDAVRETLVNTLESLGETPFTEEEVDRAKLRAKRNAEQRQSNSQVMAMALSSASGRGDWRLLFIERDRTAAVTAADVNRVARTYFRQPNRTVGVYIPTKESTRLVVPAAPALESIVGGYQGGTVAEAGEEFDPTPANLDARVKIVDDGNLKAGLLAKKNRGQTVALALTLHYGNEESLKNHTTAAGMLPGLMLAGTRKHDRQALREELDALGVRISSGGGGRGRGGRGGRGGGGGPGTPGQLSFSVDAKRDTLPKALDLLAEILREPAFPAAEFETTKLRMAAMLASGRTEPAMLAGNLLSRTLSPYSEGDVRYVPTVAESIERARSVTLEEIQRIYETQVGGGHAELAIVGDFDADATLARVKEMLSGWDAKVPYERIGRKVADGITGRTEEILTPDKSNAEYLAGLSFPLSDAADEYPALRIGNFIFGGSTLASRLGDRIRQNDGLSYGATSSLNASSRDPVGSFTITVSTNPANIDKVIAAVKEELDRFLSDGPTEKEVSEAKRAFLESQKVARTGDAAIAGQIVSNLNTGRTFAFLASQEQAIAALTPAQVAAAFRTYIDPARLVIIRAGDFKK